jgi:guanine nucleotide-binding protein G(i) subunit alpha
MPTESDVLRNQDRSAGIQEYHLRMGQLNIHMVDCGGQWSYRKKQMHQFEGVTSIIFVVDLSCYDQEFPENRMMETLELFDSVVNSRWFMHSSIILLLNNCIRFKNKLATCPLDNYFPDYSGGNDIVRAAEFILLRFNQVNRAQLRLYPQLTDPTATSNLRIVYAAIKETFVANASRLGVI